MLPVSVNLAAMLSERLVSQAYVRSVYARFAPDFSREVLKPSVLVPEFCISYCFLSAFYNMGARSLLETRKKMDIILICSRGKNLKQVLRG